MISIALFGNLQYNYSLPSDEESELLICSWNHSANPNLMIALVIHSSKIFNVRSIDIYASDTTQDLTPLRIGINNGVQEILDAADLKAADMLDIIYRHNPDIENLLAQHPSFVREELRATVLPGIAMSASTQKRL